MVIQISVLMVQHLTITPPANYNGSEDVTVTVTDGDLSDSTTFTLTVNPVNDAPTLDDLADASVAEDSDSYTLELSGADIDGDASNIPSICRCEW